MEPRRKPTPRPIDRPTAVRALSPSRVGSTLPTVAALLAIAAVGCERETILRDDPVTTIGVTLHAEVAPAPVESIPVPQPALGVLEDPPPAPPPPPTVKAKPVHPKPKPDSPPMPGGLKAVSPIDTT